MSATKQTMFGTAGARQTKRQAPTAPKMGIANGGLLSFNTAAINL